MARKIKTEQEKKKSRRRIIIILVVIILLGVGGYFGYKYLFKDNAPKKIVEVKELDNLSEYGYTLTDKDSKYFKSEYEVLKKLLTSGNVDEKEYATQVAKMFTIDLYTLSTKINKYDVGGLEYYYNDKKDMFEKKAMDTLYSSLLDDTYGDREQILPEVTNIEVVTTEDTTYSLGDNEVKGYLVKLKITYDSDMGYDKEASLVVCKEEGIRWSVVDFQPTLEPEYE